MEFKKASEIFDLYIDWKRRLEREIPYLTGRFKKSKCKHISDVACGIGAHAAALAAEGYEVTAFDPDPALLSKARVLADQQNVKVVFEEAFFHSLPGSNECAFDAAICLGNSLSLVEPGEALKKAFDGLSRLLKSAGLLVVHTVNYPMLALRNEPPWGPVRILEDDSLVLKGFIPHEQGSWDVVLIHLLPKSDGLWERKPVILKVHPHNSQAMEDAAAKAGLFLQSTWGGFAGESPDDPRSADLVYEFIRRDNE